jgi:hypothetical protein
MDRRRRWSRWPASRRADHGHHSVRDLKTAEAVRVLYKEAVDLADTARD